MPVKRDGNTVYIDGLQHERWGAGINENSVMGSMAAAFKAMGRDYSYEYLMGISGAAFRIQISRPGICPSSPHAVCGFDCAAAAIKLLPYRFAELGPKKADDAEAVASARDAVVGYIDRGVPVFFSSEENSLVVGYSDGGRSLLLRKYCAGEPGYVAEGGVPWGFLALVPDEKTLPSVRDMYITALRRARELAEADGFPVGGQEGQGTYYAAGWKAYDAWIADLSDERAIGGYDKDRLFQFQLGNGHCYYCLLDARASAAKFCGMAAEVLGGKAAGHLAIAARIYEDLASKNLSATCPTDLAPMPWMMKEGKGWDARMRAAQVATLTKARDQDRKALAEIEAALASTAP